MSRDGGFTRLRQILAVMAMPTVVTDADRAERKILQSAGREAAAAGCA